MSVNNMRWSFHVEDRPGEDVEGPWGVGPGRGRVRAEGREGVGAVDQG
ncbi:hypothetical protein B005_1489 [Nocardiopsis alba ATCC BAA-2165]|uniref:Uncharacterized protein n=1 Tax=Nocardiopsis alba (strain ATCC BAA-2165 / BE74) TaxID=1205910 RepID=J7LH60_NOCAA|nr:hypothetical protein B005_1489 [Nocardiopsis alba ATCC BAA-2165]